MKLNKKFFLVVITLFFTLSCSDKTVKKMLGGKKIKKGMTTQKMIAGLKEALKIGTEKAVKIVSKNNGYYKNKLIYIVLPKKIKKVTDKLKKIGFKKQVNDFVKKMNRAAEKAALKAVKIFWNSVKKMSFKDAKKILLSKRDNEATLYFERKTRPTLYKAFFPVIKGVLDSVGATKVYKFIIKKYNSIPFVSKVKYDLDQYVANKALNGLFLMLAKQEKKIRRNPIARVTRLLKEVFDYASSKL